MTNTMNFQDFLNKQANEAVKNTRAKAFTEFSSKKKLFASNLLTDEQSTLLNQLKNTFGFSLHIDKKYLVITLYFSATKKYGFLVLNIETMAVCEVESVKKAKEMVLELVKMEATANQVAQEVSAELPEETVIEQTTTEEKPEETVVEQKTKEKGQKQGKRNK